MKVFITGSRAYSKPYPDSDIDLVVFADEWTAKKLRDLSDDPAKKTVRFGRLNLVVCTTEEEWSCWRVATTQMEKDHKFNGSLYSTKVAKAVIDELRKRVGIEDSYIEA